MLKLELSRQKKEALKVLCLGAHSDDIEIGCGGTILRLLSECDDVEVHWVVLGSSGKRNGEAKESANKFLSDAIKKKIVIGNFKDGFFPYIGEEIKNFFEKLKKRVSPDIIFTHYRHDLHQDHRIISELTWNTFRDHLILEYEIPKYDGDLGSPNVFVHLEEMICQRKIDTILRCFESQRGRHWFTADTFQSLMRLRGIECNSSSRYAEAFFCRKIALR
jgi:LmbE family N-acetylglucosaminyl deacetylase